MNNIDRYLISSEEAVLLIIDIQDRLAVVMEERGPVIKNTACLIELAGLYDIPVIITEQYPKGLGQTVKEIRDALPDYCPVEKISFDCCGEDTFPGALGKEGKKKIVVAGMETHVCVLQTVLSLLKEGYAVHLVADAVCSRDRKNKKIALDLMANAGAVVTCTETVLFQVLKKAGTDEFRTISRMIR